MTDGEAFDMGAARATWAQKTAMQAKGKATGKRQVLAGSVDKRSLRKTGRTVQYNLRVRDGFKELVAGHAARFGFDTAIEFIEAAVAAYAETRAKK